MRTRSTLLAAALLVLAGAPGLRAQAIASSEHLCLWTASADVAEPRFKAAVLYVAGLTMERARAEVEPFDYLPRVKQPVLMLNGRYDYFFPLETAQRPFFDALGTPPDKKKWIVYEGGHDVPRTDLITETLRWLDTRLGPVR